ncbi:primosomal protein N' [Stackebrandtia nassauensis]|uniref:Probable replication restart protein PriA n=1 Tax=Stackebrandtia nassauensis (strain DSM 44728 / CIP 108903 / NRRL B-16338 / NBRC 102104 / LLR-40K-21) TaxID=446470 RepID=D3Q667_STANL|nr:primosomal protein N' [Stackebrandtia nassauensis]ADD42242.1 Primosomal protein N' (replication factor Y) - superfamily II helicase-like protein [Stackebrandtia nassauensis DSM 44728]
MLFDAPPQPVARVCVDSPLPHLDRLFDYRIPDEMVRQLAVGCRVKVRFAGRLVSGFVVELGTSTDFAGKLHPIEKLVSAEPVLDRHVAGLARAVADRYAGNLSDVLRLAVPPRQAKVEKDAPRERCGPVAAPPRAAWRRYEHGEAFLTALAEGKSPRAVWDVLPGEEWPKRLAEAAAEAAAANRGALLIMPDQRDLDRLDAALTYVLGPDRHVCLSAAQGPAKRYRAFLAARRGAVSVVAGTRAAMFAPVPNLGLVAIWDDGDDSHAEPHAPYPHAREVLLTRSAHSDCAALVAGYVRTVQGQLLIESRWATPIAAPRDTLRSAVPRVVPVGDEADLRADPDSGAARLPTVAWQAAAAALRAETPVLVQTPRRGYLPAVACRRCRTKAHCPHCHGPLGLPSSTRPPQCRWCGQAAEDYRCGECGDTGLRSLIVGAARTAEELGRAFTGVAVHASSGDKILDTVEPGPSIVVATPGAEPAVEGGYGAVLLLDAWALMNRADLRAEEETLRRWSMAAALARPASAGGTVVAVADGGLPVVQALMRWDPDWFAGRELAARAELRFPPAIRMASLTGEPAAIADLMATARPPDTIETLGPVPLDDNTERLLVRVPRRDGPSLAKALHDASAARSLKKKPGTVRVQIDPRELL